MADSTLSHITNRHSSIIPEHVYDNLESDLSGLFQGQLPQYATFSFRLKAIDPLAYLEMCWNKNQFHYYWGKPAEEVAIAAGEELISISAEGTDRFKEINAQYKEIRDSTAEYSMISHPYSGMMFLGGFSFYDQIKGNLWDSFKPASFTVPKWMIIKDGKFTLATLGINLDPFDSPDELREYIGQQIGKLNYTIKTGSNDTDSNSSGFSNNRPLPLNGSGHDEWITSVNKAKDLITQKSFKKLVLARKISVSKNDGIAPTQVLNKLRRQYTNCYNFLIHNPNDKTFLGSTPERLGAFRNNLLLTEALAGSIQRGKTATEDTVFERYLSDSKKDRNEHNFVIQDIEERLQPLTRSLNRSSEPEIKKLYNVQHLYTPIRAQLKEEIDMLTAIEQLHPTPAVGGYPWNNAAKYLKELENFERGWYAGPVGWFNANGDGEFAVAIRSGLFSAQHAHFFAGCGIVSDSNPETEWEETNLKLKPMLSALQYD